MRIRTYVIAIDAGSAPNYDPPCTTLAVCKPRIRRAAEPGELVLAFAGSRLNPHEPHTVVWAGVVQQKLDFAEYWRDRRFATKKPDRSRTPDNFYRPTPQGGFLWIDNPVHLPEQAGHDLSGRYVLAFDPAWRFGANGPTLPTEFGLRMIGGRRGERLHEIDDRLWQRLRRWLDAQRESTRPDARAGHCTPVPARCRPPAPSRRRRPTC